MNPFTNPFKNAAALCRGEKQLLTDWIEGRLVNDNYPSPAATIKTPRLRRG
jgi:hypothetical protein